MGAYDGMTDEQLIDLARAALTDWVAAPVGTIERAMKAARHEAVMDELRKRLARRLAAGLGFPDTGI